MIGISQTRTAVLDTALVTRKGLFQRPGTWGFLFITPWLAGFIVFTLGPMIASIVLSLSVCDMRHFKFVGFANYAHIFTQYDGNFYISLTRTALYVLFSVPIGLTGSLLLAVLLNQKVRGMSVYRTIYYLPSLVPAVASAYIWQYVFNPELGLLNNGLMAVGVPASRTPGWLHDPNWALPAFVIMSLWGIGGGRMIIFLAGLQGISDQYYEAAAIDGANGRQRLWHITLPLLSPVIFFNLVLGIIGSFQVFASSYLLTAGGPMKATLFYVLNLYQLGFEQLRMGYASALAWILFVILMFFTGLQFWIAKKWVHYEGEAK